jgi:hypothetical protein
MPRKEKKNKREKNMQNIETREEIGRQARFGFEELVHQLGIWVLVFENIGNLETPIHKTFGLKNHEKEDKNDVMFQFLAKEEKIAVGSILQIVGARDLWEVTDTEDKIMGGVFYLFEAKVIKRKEKN